MGGGGRQNAILPSTVDFCGDSQSIDWGHGKVQTNMHMESSIYTPLWPGQTGGMLAENELTWDSSSMVAEGWRQWILIRPISFAGM